MGKEPCVGSGEEVDQTLVHASTSEGEQGRD